MKSNTEKANQHYVPKFYLRHFSYLNNLNQIGVFNTKSEFFIKDGKLKKQASKKYFYGKDGVLEDFYQNLENILAPLVLKYIQNENIPKQFSSEQSDMLHLIFTMESRNPMRVNLMRQTLLEQKDRVDKIDSTFYNQEKQDILNQFVKNENLHKIMLDNLKGRVMLAMDLNFKLLKNTTNHPFITSDFPVVKYNQFMESQNWFDGMNYNGSGWIGQQIFFPLNEQYLLIIFDSDIYKVGNRKESVVEISNTNSVDSLNILQFLNCTNNIFFNHSASEHYIRTLFDKSKKYRKGNQLVNYDLKVMSEDGIEDDNSIILATTTSNIETKLKLEKIKIHSKGKFTKLDDMAIQWRPKAKQVHEYMERKKTKLNTV
ncbi:DUF4238 domain-containing protein [Winogradskyella poriferorum]|uniref:DUF4238 domain-containing protein n=1 Tax=Winogradskyella poriferorum TaxID=307627 RepID=A0ABU7W9E0_9FLAO